MGQIDGNLNVNKTKNKVGKKGKIGVLKGRTKLDFESSLF